jgi:hypothetical protein
MKQQTVGSSDVTFVVNAVYFLIPGLVVMIATFLCLSSATVFTNCPRPQVNVVATAFVLQLGRSPRRKGIRLPFPSLVPKNAAEIVVGGGVPHTWVCPE